MEIAKRNDKLGDSGSGGWHHHHKSRRELGKLPVIENGPAREACGGPRLSDCKVKLLGPIPEEPSLLKVEAGLSTPSLSRKDHSGLLDAYEVKMITKELCQYIESSRSKLQGKHHQARVCPDHGQARHEQSLPSRNVNSTRTDNHKKSLKGFWVGPAVICGLGAVSVVDPTTRRRTTSNHKARRASGH